MKNIMLRSKEYARSVVHTFKDRRGATAIEYGLIAALISVVIIASLQLVGGNLILVFTAVANALAVAA